MVVFRGLLAVAVSIPRMDIHRGILRMRKLNKLNCSFSEALWDRRHSVYLIPRIYQLRHIAV